MAHRPIIAGTEGGLGHRFLLRSGNVGRVGDEREELALHETLGALFHQVINALQAGDWELLSTLGVVVPPLGVRRGMERELEEYPATFAPLASGLDPVRNVIDRDDGALYVEAALHSVEEGLSDLEVQAVVWGAGTGPIRIEILDVLVP